MADTTTKDHQAAPAWLLAAEQQYEENGFDTRPGRTELLSRAREVGELLARLGVTPLAPARPGDGQLIAARLLESDPDRALWGVRATHNGRNVVLVVENWEDGLDVRPGPELTSLSAIVHVHRHGVDDDEPGHRRLRDEALHITQSLDDHPHTTGNPVLQQLRALTFALIALVDAD